MKIKDIKKIVAMVISISLVLGSVVGISTNKVKAADYGLSNPRVDSAGNVTWDCAYFGSYYQTAKWTKEPIKWRVLSVDEDNNALIVADKNLDFKRYNEAFEYVTWETSTLRSWLNGYSGDSNADGIDYSTNNFINTAFTKEEQAAIKTTTVINNDNPLYGTEGGNDTEDKVYLLSMEEVCKAEYGFDSVFDSYSKAREVKNTDYAKVNNAYTSDRVGYAGNGYWWLRSPGYDSYDANYVNCDGRGHNYRTYDVFYGSFGVRPALHINLSSSSVWTDAGVTDSQGNDGVSDNDINNPIVKNGVTTWDCIYFGSYNQTATWVKEPIKWRVLSVEGDDAFFIADKNLDCKPYNETDTSVTWETSTLRSWLNGYGAGFNGNGVDYSVDNFIDEAFTKEEQAAIKTTTVINNDESSYGTEGGNNTEDKVYTLSMEEASNVKYGFESAYSVQSKTREVKNTDYAKLNGAYACANASADGRGYWWLRSPGDSSDYASYVDDDFGCGLNSGRIVINYSIGVRPVLHINLSSDVWTHAGKVSTNPVNFGTKTSTYCPIYKDYTNYKWQFNIFYERQPRVFSNSIFNGSFDEDIASSLLDSTNYVIPGLATTNYTLDNSSYNNDKFYVPQGLCKINDASNDKYYYLISAYNSKKLNSVIYVLDSSGVYIGTLVLPNKYHNGGIAYDGINVWLTNTSKSKKDVHSIYSIKVSKILEKLKSIKEDGPYSVFLDKDDFNGEEIRINNSPSTITYSDNKIWVATNGNGESKAEPQIVSYEVLDIDTPNPSVNISNNTNTINVKDIINMPNGPAKAINGIDVYGNNIYLSLSAGRQSLIKHIYRIQNIENRYCVTHKVMVPDMSEEIIVDEDNIYVLFESGANEYNGSQGKGPDVVTERILTFKKSLWGE